ncbi:hypothetical protein RSOLAG22IIIB_13186 [Rhizoctonia solani]|uniref:Uncharacterized protein n=1 Tax=Rhizoctonia solani TaxID=456999 RepID=A0A0K6GJ07_9AGAM|nr:hypothetical protein RSOLAG22IIIB_13186 [Rhizoctonia solani]
MPFQGPYLYPIFTTYRNDVPLSLETGPLEAGHLRELFLCNQYRHNDHHSLYTEHHPDPLERRMHDYPDVEVVDWTGGPPQWILGIETGYALDSAYNNAWKALGEALQAKDWNKLEPWKYHGIPEELAKLNMPFEPPPSTFYQGVNRILFTSLTELQATVHRNNLYAMYLTGMAYIVNATKMNFCHNLCPSGWMRGSPGFVAAERHWRRLRGFPVLDPSEDDESTADFDEAIQEQEVNPDALVASATPPDPSPTMEMEDEQASTLDSTQWEAGALRQHFGHSVLFPFAVSNVELLRGLGERRDYIRAFSRLTLGGSPPLVPTEVPDFDLDDLIDRLEAIPREDEVPDLPGWDYDSTRQEPPEATSEVPSEPFVWPAITQQATPPLSWEDFWSTLDGEGVNTTDEDEVNGSLANHVILTHPSVSN